jgi:hypothetical protein
MKIRDLVYVIRVASERKSLGPHAKRMKYHKLYGVGLKGKTPDVLIGHKKIFPLYYEFKRERGVLTRNLRKGNP